MPDRSIARTEVFWPAISIACAGVVTVSVNVAIVTDLLTEELDAGEVGPAASAKLDEAVGAAKCLSEGSPL